MPTYEYECTKCGRIFELFQSITASPKRKPDEPCDGCGERAPIRRLIGGGGAILFKGTGFYETDYRSDSYKQAAKSEADSVKPKSEGGADGGDKHTGAKERKDKAPAKSAENTGLAKKTSKEDSSTAAKSKSART